RIGWDVLADPPGSGSLRPPALPAGPEESHREDARRAVGLGCVRRLPSVAAEGEQSRVSVPGAGEVRLTGPASARVGHADGVADFALLSGDAEFAFGGGSVRLAVEGGSLRVSGVNGRSATLARGTEIRIDGAGDGPRVTVETGSALFSGDLEHVLLRASESREFGPPRDDMRMLVLSGQD